MSKLPTREEYEKREAEKVAIEQEIKARLSVPALRNEIERLRERIAEGDMQLKNQIELLEEDFECVHKWLDEQHAPRYENEKELSIIGRIMRIGHG